MHTVDHFGDEGQFNGDQVYECVLWVRWQSNIQCFMWKDAICGFLFCKVVQNH